MEIWKLVVDQPRRIGKFLFYDVPGILYDYEEDGTSHLSLPRLMFGLGGLLISVAYVREHFMGVPFENFSQLVMFFGAAVGGYASKRFANAIVDKEKEEHDKKEDERGD